MFSLAIYTELITLQALATSSQFTNIQTFIMSKLTLIISLVVAQFALCASYSINIALKVEEHV